MPTPGAFVRWQRDCSIAQIALNDQARSSLCYDQGYGPEGKKEKGRGRGASAAVGRQETRKPDRPTQKKDERFVLPDRWDRRFGRRIRSSLGIAPSSPSE